MRAFGHEDDAARVAACFECGLYAQDPAQFAVRPGLGRHRNAVHPGQLDQPDRKLVDDRQRALHSLNGLHGVHIGKPRHPSDFFIEARIMLHRATAQREESQVDGVILATEPRVVPYRFRFRQTGQSDIAAALEAAKTRGDLRRLGKIDTSGPAIPDLKISASSSISALLPV